MDWFPMRIIYILLNLLKKNTRQNKTHRRENEFEAKKKTFFTIYFINCFSIENQKLHWESSL